MHSSIHSVVLTTDSYTCIAVVGVESARHTDLDGDTKLDRAYQQVLLIRIVIQSNCPDT
jgi:hypothetical protein